MTSTIYQAALPMAAAPSPNARQSDHQAATYLSHSSALLSSDSFQWFLKECVERAIAEAQEAALDLEATAETCDRARHVRAALVAVRDWAGQQREWSRGQLEA